MRVGLVSLLAWALMMSVAVGVSFALGGLSPETATWVMRASGLMLMAGAAGILHGSRGPGQRKTRVYAITMLAFGALQFIPSVDIRAILMIPIVLAMLASMAGVPRRFFRNESPSAK